ncbi:type III-B CRISPR module RAMP protein Cmr4 [Desulfoscipio geothermicus]|uniref:CRISPR-associated protein Cmr4 n=1 Tax=Desulfoscipio geothermicus DSM 3669 TaxID=1121426 RepID=A0A1I6EDS7_9FIRM|nr:type III-B CRISPR module RAMP protein Cmr4 [Desulfoscipio geothermicus]SFR15893.1 CRISPR-associated protein Cmr4 [Desulfoscipio geothermicus DSM 3669]
MYKTAKPLFFICETPLHAGSGNDLGIVDLPLQRERHTGFPKLEGSGVKGCIREAFEEKGQKGELVVGGVEISGEDEFKKAIALAFGPEEGDKHAGALGFTDARLLLFPVKSMKGVFAWVTCPRVLERLRRELGLCDMKPDFEVPPANAAPAGCNLYFRENKIILEEYTFKIDHKDDPQCTALARWLSKQVFPDGNIHGYWRGKVEKDIVVLSDDDFRDFVNLSTEVATRTKIDNKTGTVAEGHLFTEEYLPQEAVLYSLVLFGSIFSDDKGVFVQGRQSGGSGKDDEVLQDFIAGNMPRVIQLGGDASTGKGLVWTNFCR